MIRSLFNRLTYTDDGISLTSYRLSKYIAGLPRKYPRLFLKEIELDKLLMGGEAERSSATHARIIGDLLRPSRPIPLSPHAELLRGYQASGDNVFLPARFEATSYYKNAAQCIELYGKYFAAKRPEDIVGRARKFCHILDGKTYDKHEIAESEPGSYVIVRPIKFSDCYEIIDGHHRLAVASVNGRKYKCLVQPSVPVLTPIQEMILASNWTNGHREIYQPISSPELTTWPVVRRCADRLTMMEKYLAARDIRSGSYLDICCSYGWFVAQMGQRGFQAAGIDRDNAAVSVGRLAYGLHNSATQVADLTTFFDKPERCYDIVSCFSVLHHYVLGAIPGSAAEFIRKVDAVTGRVLFFDTGECHEDWFKETLAGWNAEFIQKWLKENTSFTRVELLGTDTDNVGPYENQYQRHLFACSRNG